MAIEAVRSLCWSSCACAGAANALALMMPSAAAARRKCDVVMNAFLLDDMAALTAARRTQYLVARMERSEIRGGCSLRSWCRITLPRHPGYNIIVTVIPGCAPWRRPGIHTPDSWLWIPGSRFARPGMTGLDRAVHHHLDQFRTGSAERRLQSRLQILCFRNPHRLQSE